MSYKLLLLILSSVGLSALAQILLKTGMSTGTVQVAMASGGMPLVQAIMTSTHVILGLALYGAGALIWLLVLARIDVSVAYPFVGLGFVVTLALAWLILNEPIGMSRVFGTLLVGAGVYFVAHS